MDHGELRYVCELVTLFSVISVLENVVIGLNILLKPWNARDSSAVHFKETE